MSDLDLVKIGNFIKLRRSEKELSIRDLASLSNIAASTISQIETGKTSPNLASLYALCESLQVPVAALFMEETIDNIKLVRKNEQKTFVRNVSNGQPLIETLITKGENEMWGGIVNIPPRTDSGNYAYHGGEEFVHVLKGCITFDLENYQNYKLYEEDTLYYPNHVGHRWINDSDEESRILIVSTSPYNK